MIIIREEVRADFDQREALLDQAFGACRFEKTCERLREGRVAARGLALVADHDEEIVGSIRLWNVKIGHDVDALLLGPLAVAANSRSCGLGGRLMLAALNRASIAGHTAIILVGDARYYSRFGFSTQNTNNFWLPGPVDRDRLLALELVDGALKNASGPVTATGHAASAYQAIAYGAICGLDARKAA